MKAPQEVRGTSMEAFLPMDKQGQPLQETATKTEADGIERRRHSRHRYSSKVEIHRQQGLDVDAMTFELSEGGMSAATPNILTIGEKVEVKPLLGRTVMAIVRRKCGVMYGFEFVELSEETREKIREFCQRLPLFTTMLDV